MTQDCIFCKIVAGDIPAQVVYQDDHVLAFYDINPATPVHVLIIPKRHYESLGTLAEADAGEVGHLLAAASKVAEAAGVAQTGYRLTFNMGRDAHLVVYHLHAHLMGGRRLGWPPG